MNAVNPPREACPSRLRFDQLLAGELDSAQAQQLETHVGRCARCDAVLAEIRRGYRAFSPLLPDAVARRVRGRSAQRDTWQVRVVPLLTAAALLLAWIAWPTPPADAPVDTVRSKGGARLRFYVLQDGVVRLGADGEQVQPGDQIEFEYTTEHDAYLTIVSIDAARKASVYYAAGDHAAKIAAGSRMLLDQSTRLDDTLGAETVYALLCTQPIAVAPLLQALERAPEQAPVTPDCGIERLVLQKVAR
jgi:hypothetical protein